MSVFTRDAPRAKGNIRCAEIRLTFGCPILCWQDFSGMTSCGNCKLLSESQQENIFILAMSMLLHFRWSEIDMKDKHSVVQKGINGAKGVIGSGPER